ncbi:unnamed protein product [Aphanomyces euteiches]
MARFCDVFELGFTVPPAPAQESQPMLKKSAIFDVKWMPNSASRICVVCKDSFGWFRKRRHHCRLCGKLVCNPCSLARSFVRISSSAVELERTCTLCSTTLKQLVDLGDSRVKLTATKTIFPIMRPHSMTAVNETSIRYDIQTPHANYVVSAEWYRRYQACIKNKSSPGPISNHTLLQFYEGKLRPRPSLHANDFKLLEHDEWAKLLQFYGGGPCITLTETSKRTWRILFPFQHTEQIFEEEIGHPSTANVLCLTEPRVPVTKPKSISMHKAQSVNYSEDSHSKARLAAAAFAEAASLARREAESLAMRKSMASLADYDDVRQSLGGYRYSMY